MVSVGLCEIAEVVDSTTRGCGLRVVLSTAEGVSGNTPEAMC